MTNEEYKKFIRRYDKFKKNNLPTPFWDEERQTLEYVYFYNGKSILNDKEARNELEINSSLSKALGEIAFTGFYYSFTARCVIKMKENGKMIQKSVVRHDHAHSFEEVVKALYNSPESFNISKEEEKYYSKQELEYLKRVQKYLLFIGMKDLKEIKAPVSRYRNKIHSKYENVFIYKLNDFSLNKVLEGKINFRVSTWYSKYEGPRIYKPKEYRALIVDNDDNFKVYVEFTHEDVKFYKDIKEVYKDDTLKDEDKLIIKYFKILEIFD